MLSNISVTEFMKLKDINIIDIRMVEKYNNSHINDSKNIPMDKLLQNPNIYLNRNVRYYIYCQKGISSSKVCNYLLSKGYNVVNVVGGYEEWLIKSK